MDPARSTASRGADWAVSQPPVATLTYRSEATAPFAPSGLERLLARAKTRNRALGVTGMLLFADNRFYQWLEGPPEGVARVWDDIRKDPRHREVEMIDHHRRSMRLFGEWDMKFVSREPHLADLRDRAARHSELPEGLIHLMAELALQGKEAAIVEGLRELLLMGHDFISLHGILVEPAARVLGDWWLEDRVRDIEITVGLCHLQSAVRLIGAGETTRIADPEAARRILIAAQPGEAHGLGVALVGDLLRRSGWRVTSDFPATTEALTAGVRSQWFDVMSLCLSDVFDRADQIAPLAEAIRIARAASRNRSLVVVAGGRLFQTQPDLAEFIGADAVYGGAAEALAKIVSRTAPSEGPVGRDVRETRSLH